jgi:hypothetical protein
MTFLIIFNNPTRTKTNLLIEEITETWSDPRILNFLIPQSNPKPSFHGGAKLKLEVIP